MPNNQNQSKNNTSTADTNEINTNQVHNHKLVRILYIVAGVGFLLLGIVGIILPVMPTTVFVILAAYCWAKGSERFHKWLINHHFFGKILTDWYEKRAMPRKAKYLAWSMMTLSCGFLYYQLPRHLCWVAFLTSVSCLAVSIWMARLPDA